MSPPERRTTALRGPGAGGFTPPTSVAASNPCLNCGTNIQLDYCPECGQREIDSDPTLREFLHELAEEFLHWDGKLVTTFRTLVTRPGELTMEYLAGRRVRYISPLRLYLSCSVLFFFLSAIVPKPVVLDRSGHTVSQGVVQVGQSTQKELAALLQRETLSSVPKAMFVLVPLFAALVGLTYRDRRRRYPQHLAFALHVHAALFLTLCVMLVGRLFTAPVVSLVYELLVLVPFAVYVQRATRKVYNSGMAQVVWRLTLVFTTYFMAFIAVLTALFAMIVLTT